MCFTNIQNVLLIFLKGKRKRKLLKNYCNSENNNFKY